jgi:YegS/Rv2252/BmrU family lipid kinase
MMRSVCEVFRERGWSIEVCGTEQPDDAAKLAHQGMTAAVDVVAIYGGDGTVHQVAGAVGNRVPIGLIPGGTGNLLAGNLRLPRSPKKAAEVIVNGAPRRFDLGKLTVGDAVKFFTVACGAGFDAELMAGTTGEAKRRWGMGAYVAKAYEVVGRHQPVRFRVIVDDMEFDAEAASVMVANCGEIIPPFLRLRDGIVPDDGLLDVVVLNATGFVETAGVLWQLVRGAPDNGRVRHVQGRSVRVECDEPRPVELDGEAAGMTPFAAEIVPDGLRIVLPRAAGRS